MIDSSIQKSIRSRSQMGSITESHEFSEIISEYDIKMQMNSLAGLE
jgi:hypothetical protein